MGRLQHIIFDWDGVLNDSIAEYIVWYQKCCTAHGKVYPYTTNEEFKAELIEPAVPLMYNKLGFNWEKDQDSIWALWTKHKAEAKPMLFEEVPGLFERIAQQGIQMHIATSNVRANITRGLQDYGLDRYIGVIVTKEDLPLENTKPKLKPNPDIFAIALDKIRTDGSDVITIGDEVSDIRAARRLPELGKNSLKVIAVTYGYGKMQDLVNERPDALALNVNDLEWVIANYWASGTLRRGSSVS